MSKRLRCECGFELSSPTQYCLNCGRKHAFGCGIHVSSDRIRILFVGNESEIVSLKRYEESIRNLYEVAAERIYERRVEEITLAGDSAELIKEAFEELSKAFYPFRIVIAGITECSRFFEEFERSVKIKRRLKTFAASPEDKIHGSHSTIIGGREGYNFILKLASCPYVKKVVPGVIEVGGCRGGGVRLKLTRCDEKGNIRALLIEGSTVQQVFVITTASNKEEGEFVMKFLASQLNLC